MRTWKPYSIDWPAIQRYYDEGHGTCECIRHFGLSKATWFKGTSKGKVVTDPGRRPNKWSNLPQDITGKRFGKLVAIKKLRSGGRKGGGSIWLCQCDCGNTTESSVANLNIGDKRSCGCAHFSKGCDHPLWKGYGEIGAGQWGNIKNNAIARGLEFTVTIQQAWEKFQLQQGKCAISGIGLTFGRGRLEETTASLDRIDSTKGYIPGNLWWVHKDVNLMKLDHTMGSFLLWIDAIYHFQHAR